MLAWFGSCLARWRSARSASDRSGPASAAASSNVRETAPTLHMGSQFALAAARLARVPNSLARMSIGCAAVMPASSALRAAGSSQKAVLLSSGIVRAQRAPSALARTSTGSPTAAPASRACRRLSIPHSARASAFKEAETLQSAPSAAARTEAGKSAAVPRTNASHTSVSHEGSTGLSIMWMQSSVPHSLQRRSRVRSSASVPALAQAPAAAKHPSAAKDRSRTSAGSASLVPATKTLRTSLLAAISWRFCVAAAKCDSAPNATMRTGTSAGDGSL
mmetsp:Transcript_10134/g.31457  ORF Transcript_10134/g.31457 Transcript_10134/m.31457 type:complete len:276 (-) Transcript_10134:276-1103(-)